MGCSKNGAPQVMINRALVISGIIEKYTNIIGKVTQNKDKKIVFDLNNGKKKLKLTLDDPSNLTYKSDKKKPQGVLLNRRFILPLLEVLNGVKNE